MVAGCGVRVWPVGRLDLDSEGLLLMTDDGAMTHRLLHPSHEVEKEYHVWVRGDLPGALPVLNAPMELDGKRLRPAAVRVLSQEGSAVRLSVVIREGKKRQIRRMCASAGLAVTRLKRVREGGLLLDETLKPGQWRFLTAEERDMLYQG
jgi:23S rRNA pseudouridine2605 synthase